MLVEELFYKKLRESFNCTPIKPPSCAKKVGYFFYKDDIRPDQPVSTRKEFVDILDDSVKNSIQKFFETNLKNEPIPQLFKNIDVNIGGEVNIFDGFIRFLKDFLGINATGKIGAERAARFSIELSDCFYRGLDETDIENYAYSRKFKIHPLQKEKYEGKRISLIHGELAIHKYNIGFYDKYGVKIGVSDIINVDAQYINGGDLSINAMENCKDGATIGIYATDLIGKGGFFVDDEELRGEVKIMEIGIGHRNDLAPYMNKMKMLVINLE